MTLILDNLTVRRGEREIISGLSLTVGAGQAVLLSGPNGAGKTTLLRAIAGLLPIEDGVLRLSVAAGPDASEDEVVGDEVGERCHYVGHLNAVKAQLTVAENARFWAAYLGGPEAGVAAAIGRLQLSALAGIKAGYLSAGQKRRLGLVRMLVVARPLWLLDEPLVSLDTAS